MARIPYVDPDKVRAEMRPLVEQIKVERGRVSGLYQLLLNAPAVCSGWLHMGTAVRQEASLSGDIRELVICRVAKITGAEYEWQSHAPIALDEGVTQEQLDDLDTWESSDAYSPQQRAALAIADQITNQLDADDDTFAAVQEHFDNQETLELVTTAAFYNMVSRVLRTMRVH